MIDIHCHILPGVDDGSRSKEESLLMLAQAKAAGITQIVCTPHYKSNSYSQQPIDDAFEWFSAQAEEAGIETILGYEIHWKKILSQGIDDVFAHVIGDTKLALIEFSAGHNIGQFEQRALWKLRGRGIIPIIAHPERYVSVQKNLTLADELKDAGCLLQMSADTIEASMFSGQRKAYKYLLKNGMYDYVASDAHSPEDYELFIEAAKIAQSVISTQKEIH